ncbi:MAG: hypothetical protein JW734_07620 [Candidatus Omnitrophica bacterium]|nr:hypothetical protein [Candidatus Omnitrophota bacterium]
MSRLNIFLSILAIWLLLIPADSLADGVSDEIKKGLEAYENKEYRDAISSLEFAAQQIRQLKAAGSKKALPEPLPGWKAQEAESTAVSEAFMGGFTTATRNYTKDEARIRIEIVSDSPFISMITAMIANPFLNQTGEIEVMKIKGHKAILEWNEDTKKGTLKVVVENKVLVSTEGENCQKSDVIAYAEAVNYVNLNIE